MHSGRNARLSVDNTTSIFSCPQKAEQWEEVLSTEYELYLMRVSALSPKVKAVKGYIYSSALKDWRFVT
jgi:hypothetical protein